MESRFDKGRRFSRRVLALRSLGCALSAILIFATVYPAGASHVVLSIWAINAFVWPTVAHMLAMRAPDPVAAERRNLLLDSIAGGAWAAAMHFSAAPSAVLISMLLMHNAAAGGVRLLWQGSIAVLLGACLAGVLTGFAVNPASDVLSVAACLPLLMLYPTLVALSTYTLAQQLSQSKKEIREMSGHDDLTTLRNRRFWMKAVIESFEKKSRMPDGIAYVALIDIDGFKQVNDTYGHLRGDTLIRAAGTILRETLTSSDVAGRYGGDEFAVLFEGEPLASVLAKLNAVSVKFARAANADVGASGVTLSIGVAALDKTFRSVTDWLAASDAALYAAKRGGKNKMAVWGRADMHSLHEVQGVDQDV